MLELKGGAVVNLLGRLSKSRGWQNRHRGFTKHSQCDARILVAVQGHCL